MLQIPRISKMLELRKGYKKETWEPASCLSHLLGSRIALPKDKQRQSAHACMIYTSQTGKENNAHPFT